VGCPGRETQEDEKEALITAVDSNVLIDILIQDPTWWRRSHQKLTEAAAEGSLVIHEIVAAEIALCFADEGALKTRLDEADIRISESSVESAFAAGKAYQRYRRQGGTKGRVLADFMIGAHANRNADRLLTRDRGYYRTYFPGLQLLEP
jgi:predicted nucleic acid-binding protein